MAWNPRPVYQGSITPFPWEPTPWCELPVVTQDVLPSGYQMLLGNSPIGLGIFATARMTDWPNQPIAPPQHMDPNVPAIVPHDLPPSLWPFGLQQSGYVPAFAPGSAIGEFMVGCSSIGVIPSQPTQVEFERSEGEGE